MAAVAEKSEKKGAVKSKKEEKATTVFAFSTKGQNKTNANLLTVPINKVHVQPGFNPRKKLDSIEDLVASVKANGIINPPTARPDLEKPGHYNIVAGHRRFAAWKETEKPEITIQVRFDIDDDAAAKALSAAESSADARFDLSYLDKGRLYNELANEKGWSVVTIAKECAAEGRTVRRCMEFAALDSKYHELVEKGLLPVMGAIELAKIEREEVRKEIIDDHLPQEPEKEGSLSLANIKRLEKEIGKRLDAEAAEAAEAAAGGGEGGDEGAEGGEAAGGTKKAPGTAWKSSTEKTRVLAELCFDFLNPPEGHEGSQAWHEQRGAIAWALFDRGDISWPAFPPVDPADSPNPKTAAKDNKRNLALMKAYAEKHQPPEQPAPESPGVAGEEAA